MTEKFVIDVAQYVGANIPFDFVKHSGDLKPFLKHYRDLYRIWDSGEVDEVEALARKSGILPTSRSLEALLQLAMDGDHNDGDLITVHQGIGFSPMAVLKRGLSVMTKEKSFVEDIIMYNDYQKEILLLRAEPEFDFYGMLDGESIERF